MRHKKAKMVFLAVAAASLLVGCTQTEQKEAPNAPKSTSEAEKTDTGEPDDSKEAFYNENEDKVQYQGVLYDINEKKKTAVAVSYWDLEMTEVVFPDIFPYKGTEYRVVSIAESAFETNTLLEKVKFSDSMKKVGKNAFYNCSELTRVEFGNGVKSIGDQSFGECPKLKELVWGDSLETIGESAFMYDEALEEITIPGSVKSYSPNAFCDCYGLKKCTFEEGSVIVGAGMFTNCHALEEVILPEGMTAIQEEAFWDCNSLKELVLPDTVVMIGSRAFYGASIQKLALPPSVSGDILDILDGIFELKELEVTAAQKASYEDALSGLDIKIVVAE